MAKPTGSLCNLACAYCFYLEKADLFPQRRRQIMSAETLESFVRQHIAAQPGNVVEFAWQGGEPTLAGLDFYRQAVRFQRRHALGKHIENSIQTNGLLIDDAWCRFFRDHRWLVGISIDGPAEMHDAYRTHRGGGGSHAKVVAAIDRLVQHRVEFNLLTTVNDRNVTDPEGLYRYLSALGSPHLQFIPVVERLSPEGDAMTPWSVDPQSYGRFLTRIFDTWVRNDIGSIYVQLFESTLAVWCGLPPQICVFAETCGHAFALEADGDLYQCDHYVYPSHLVGNIHATTLKAANRTRGVEDFGQRKQATLSQDCRACDVGAFCRGDCPKHRLAGTSRSYLCESYRAFFRHTAPFMMAMRQLIVQERQPAELMAHLRASGP